MSKRNIRDLSQCPDPNCSGGRPNRQHPLTVGQRDRITGPEGEIVAEKLHDMYRCNYCGCVYVRGLPHTRRLGYLDDPVTGKVWITCQSDA